ncbi:MAG TPA: hypothetical protein IAC41_08355 [Candidatus Merdenecus merdavium]|nr:hypothetical protein [Candidatus Merdenecus merdavium]
MLEGNLKLIVDKYGNDDRKLVLISEYKDSINRYTFSVIEIQDAPLDIATEIFTRINTSGKSLSVFEIMCAKTYDENREFDLYEKRKKQLDKWEGVNYNTVSH